MPQTAFIVQVPQAENCVADLRACFDASANLGVPAHLSILVPFMSPELITPAVLTRAQAALNGLGRFAFTLNHVGRFEATAYLAPEPAAPFVAMTEALVRAFPGFLPFGGEHATIIPHLTVAHGDATEAEAAAIELATRLQLSGPINCQCDAVTLLENTTGRWQVMYVFELPQTGQTHTEANGRSEY